MEVDSLIAHVRLVLSVKWIKYCCLVLVQKSPAPSTILLKLNMLLLRSIQNECPQATKDCHEERYQKLKALYMECQKERFATYKRNGLVQFQITGFRSHLSHIQQVFSYKTPENIKLFKEVAMLTHERRCGSKGAISCM